MTAELLRKLAAGVVLGGAVTLAGAQAVSLQEQLTAQYKLSKMGSDSTGYSVVEEGTLLAVEKGGILGLPYKSTIWPNATYQDGNVKTSAAQSMNSGKAADISKKLCGFTHKCPGADSAKDASSDERSTHLFKKGDKVYVTKINVDTGKDTVTLSIVACESCTKSDKKDDKADPTYNKANLIFPFAKGTLAGTSAGQVEDTIGQVLSISSDDAQQAQGGDQGQQQGGQDQGQQQQAAQPAAEPAEVKLGMTPDQVEVALGKPDKKVSLATKQIYIYKDMKVTFVNGRVSDVQ